MTLTSNDKLQPVIYSLLASVFKFAADGTDLTLRTYQRQVAAAITESVITNAGRSFVVMFPRQSGKNELQAQIEAYLMTLYSSSASAEIIKVSPTWRPQTLNAMRRLQRTLETNKITAWSEGGASASMLAEYDKLYGKKAP